jgi:predicted amidohydrolase
MRGAELFVHSTSDVAGGPRAPKQVAKLARAVENMAYVVSANSAGIEGTPIPAASTDGFSVIVDDRGLVLAEAGAGESVVANAEVDLGALRRRRRRPGMANLLSRQRFELFAASYASARFSLPGGLAGEFTGKEQLLAAQRETIERLARLGVI